MSNLKDLLKELQPQGTEFPVKGILIMDESAPEGPGYIYADKASNINTLLDKTPEEEPPIKAPKGSFQKIIDDAFFNDNTDLYALDQELSQLDPKPKQFKCGVVIRTLTDEGRHIHLATGIRRELFENVKAFFPKENVALLKDSIYILFTSDEIIHSLNFPRIEEFQKMLKKYNAYAMVGNSSQWLKGLKVLFRQCYSTLPIAIAVRFGEEKNRRVLKYNRYAYYYQIYLAEEASGKSMGSKDVLYLVDSAVLTLTRYDRAFNGDLRDTLFNYLMNDRNISETSRQLFVHRNTVIYKLDKIKELIGETTLENPYIRHNLISSCMTIRYVENYHKQQVQLPPIEKSLLKRDL